MKKIALLAGVVTVVAGCATVSNMEATSGSRADGIVKMSFEYGMFDRVEINQAEALEKATKRCNIWGYTGAEAFGGITRQCQGYGSLGCRRWFVTQEFQCTSTALAAPVAGNVPLPQAIQTTGGISVPVSTPMTATQVPGAQNLGGGVWLVPAKTPSGYCIKAPSGYRGTGSVSRPSVSSMKPLCQF